LSARLQPSLLRQESLRFVHSRQKKVLGNQTVPKEITEKLKSYDADIQLYLGQRNRRRNLVADQHRISHNLAKKWFLKRAIEIKAIPERAPQKPIPLPGKSITTYWEKLGAY